MAITDLPFQAIARYRTADQNQFDTWKAQNEANQAAYDKYKAAFDTYKAAVDKWNAGPRTSPYAGPAEPTLAYPHPEIAKESFQATVDAAQAEAQRKAARDQAAATHAFTLATNPAALEEKGINLSGFGFAQGGVVPNVGWMQGVGSLFQKFINR